MFASFKVIKMKYFQNMQQLKGPSLGSDVRKDIPLSTDLT